ncbi:GntR family transcriptional regulator [Mesorhizobium sp. LHD-90]|uniref:GntR family transcriptional regulator n=1 Tax=Mesorhizobium sp. LHD-90 TaxID=3071414 RepID=UPI0027E17B4B|nr:GntR family transcriptional regulator [Mesorhizobium sp. LHD-90]MDQ6435355.1 GntR family transcriptional regulator [Mesorhizobium sp. LHD-90]
MRDSNSLLELFPKRALAREGGPLYRQLADILRRPISDGVLAVGEELPKEASIAEHFGVSLITVRHALRDLEGNGLIRKRSAKPAVVAARETETGPVWHMANFTDIAAFARDASLDVLSYRRETSSLLQHYLGARKGEAGYCLRSVLKAGDEKKAYVTTYFPAEIGERLSRRDFTDVLIFDTVQRKFGLRLAVAHMTVRAEVADESMAEALDVEPGSALLTVEMLYQASDGRNVELSVARHPADRFSITYDAPNDRG